MNMSLPSAAADSSASASLPAGYTFNRASAAGPNRLRVCSTNEVAVGRSAASSTPPRISSAFQPASSGTFACLPAAKVDATGSVSTTPSMAGENHGCHLLAAASSVLGRFRAQRLGRRGPEGCAELLAVGFTGLARGGRERGPEVRAALADDLVEQPAGLRDHHHGVDGERSRRLAEDGDVAGVAAECRDVVAYPLQGRHHVEQRVVARTPAQVVLRRARGAPGSRRRRGDS